MAQPTVQFTDLSFTDIIAWIWDFGDGTFSTEQNPLHVFPTYDIYQVTLYVFGAFGGSDHTTQTLNLSWAYCQAMDIDNGGYTPISVSYPPDPTLYKATYIPGGGWGTHVSVFVDTTTQIYLNFAAPCTIKNFAMQMASNSTSGMGIVRNNFNAIFYYPYYDPAHPADNIVTGVAHQAIGTAPGTYTFSEPVDDTILIGGMQVICGEGVQGDSTFLIQIIQMEGYVNPLVGNFC